MINCSFVTRYEIIRAPEHKHLFVKMFVGSDKQVGGRHYLVIYLSQERSRAFKNTFEQNAHIFRNDYGHLEYMERGKIAASQQYFVALKVVLADQSRFVINPVTKQPEDVTRPYRLTTSRLQNFLGDHILRFLILLDSIPVQSVSVLGKRERPEVAEETKEWESSVVFYENSDIRR